MYGKEIDDIIKEEMKIGEKITKLKYPYYRYYGYEEDPFDRDIFFLGEKNETAIRLISRFIAESKNKLPYFIAIIGPKWIGKTILINKVHGFAIKKGISGRVVLGNEFTQVSHEEKLDGERFKSTKFETLLKQKQALDYLIIDQTDKIARKLNYYLHELKNKENFIESGTMVFVSMNAITWRQLPKQTRDIFYKRAYIFPLTKKESKGVAIKYLKKNSEKDQDTCSKEALDMISSLSYGYLGLMIYLLRESMKRSCEMGYEKVPLMVVNEIAEEKAFKVMPIIMGTNEKEVYEGKNKFRVYEEMILNGRPIDATNIFKRTGVRRSTVATILGNLHMKNIAIKLPKVGKTQPYSIRIASKIAFEHRCMELEGIYHE